MFILQSSGCQSIPHHHCGMNSVPRSWTCSLKWRMDVWPIKCYVPIAKR